MNRTTAPGSSGGLYVDDNPALGVVGTLNVAADRNAVQEEIIAAIVGAGLTPAGADLGQLIKAIDKRAAERGKYVGEVFSLLDRRAPAAWSDSTPDAYFPAVCLSAIDTYLDVAAANAPDLVPYLRGRKLKWKDGLTGELTAAVVTNWAIAENVATLTFQNDADHIAWLTSILEDEMVHGSYTNWLSITLPNAIGSIAAGDYALTNVNPTTRQVSFAFVAANGSGSVTASAEFFPHRVPGSTTTARLLAVKGRAIVSANDGEAVSGLRRRDRMQGHFHQSQEAGNISSSGGAKTVITAQGNITSSQWAQAATSDGTNGTPRTGLTTDPRAFAAHLYIHAGRYL